MKIAGTLLKICVGFLTAIPFSSYGLSDVIVDNGQAGTSSTGTWAASGATNSYGNNSLWSYNGATYTWTFTPTSTGMYKVSMWWTSLSTRSSSVPVLISHSGGIASTTINQQQNGGKWNDLGQYTMNAGTTYGLRITAPKGTPPSTCADAVKWAMVTNNSEPNAIITSITPNPANAGQTVSFSGTGTDTDGTITAYDWQSSIDGALSTQASFTKNNLSIGTHTISFKVQDNLGAWSETVTRQVVVNNSTPADIIIDNGSANCTYSGVWGISGGTGYYGTNAYWSRNGATYTWKFTPTVTGNYEVFAWWSAFNTRSSSVPIDIYNSSGTNRVSVNQKLNGSKWNSLGKYSFQGGVTYNVKVTASNGDSVSTCADGIKLTYSEPINIQMPPTAQILSISPNPGMPNQNIVFKGKATDSDGTITAYSWRSSIDGTLGTTSTLNKALTAGTHTVYFKAQDNSGLWSPEVSATLDVGLENIYIAQCYGGNEIGNLSFTSVLDDLGATQKGTNEWTYTRSGKTYYIHFITTAAEVLAALARDGAHVMIEAHSNYGLGPVFSTSSENSSQMLTNLRYVDDDRFIHFGTPTVGVSISGMRTGQAYPYWWPIYKDGKSAIAPFTFNDPNGPPPYNYYMTYQVPGDSNYYKIETVNKSAYERFSDTDKPAWYSSTGAVPNPNNANDKQYFITNDAAWSPSIASSGTWTQYQELPANQDNASYFKENYFTNAAGTGSDYFKYLFTIPTAGQYKVSAWWPALSTNASNSPFTIYYSGGSTTVTMNQTTNGQRWNSLGTYNFNKGNYSVVLTDAASSRNVVADGVKISHINNPAEIVQANFIAEPMSGPAPLDVEFDNISTGDTTDRTWNCGDGFTNTTRDDLDHTYTTPGTYTVTLTVSGPLGSSTKTKTGYITVLPSGQQSLPFKVEFDASSTNGQIPLNVKFEDMSSGLGDINNVSWAWNFGDGQTSSKQDPNHVYRTAGNYTVSLEVTNESGTSATETKTNLVRAVVYEKIIDNVDYPKTHFSKKTIVKTKGVDIAKNQLKYGRMLYGSCNSGDYYLQTLGHGLMFYTTATSSGEGSLAYLQMYLLGYSDQQIWEYMQQIEACYDYYNFNLPPMAGQAQTGLTSLSSSATEAFTLTSKQQAEIAEIKILSTADAFGKLCEGRYIANLELSKKAISEVFAGAENEAVDYALNILLSPAQKVNKLTIAKRILLQFSNISAGRLSALYPQADESINVNIINAAGAIVSDPGIRSMLIKALDDKYMTYDDNPELVGEPLRICDVAYNQLVLNLKVKGVLRTIGTGMPVETRDYHIGVLKTKL
jgi:PKD repeat protein